MKRAIVVAAMLVLVGCGGGGGQGDEVVSGNPSPSPSPEATSALSISSVIGDGSGPDRVATALTVNGSNFADGMIVNLSSTTSTASYSLNYELKSASQIKAALPSGLNSDEYSLSITKSSEKATVAVTILKGEKGDTGAAGATGATGPQGPAGQGGVVMAEEYSCGLSGDIDNTADSRYGVDVSVVKFSDGSYFVSCIASYFNLAASYADTSSYSTWYASNSKAVVTDKKIVCIPLYVSAEYSIPNHTVTYINIKDETQKETLACTQVYP